MDHKQGGEGVAKSSSQIHVCNICFIKIPISRVLTVANKMSHHGSLVLSRGEMGIFLKDLEDRRVPKNFPLVEVV
jgi:hypothetical protein